MTIAGFKTWKVLSDLLLKNELIANELIKNELNKK